MVTHQRPVPWRIRNLIEQTEETLLAKEEIQSLPAHTKLVSYQTGRKEERPSWTNEGSHSGWTGSTHIKVSRIFSCAFWNVNPWYGTPEYCAPSMLPVVEGVSVSRVDAGAEFAASTTTGVQSRSLQELALLRPVAQT